MPLYEYRCDKCGHQFEVLQKLGENKAECPRCESKKTRKLLSMFSSENSGSGGGGGACLPTGGGGG